MKIIQDIVQNLDQLTTIRRQIHTCPEIALTESKTAELIASTLENQGIEVHRNIGITGLVAIIHGQEEGPSIALRADMDALPMQETGNMAYRSQVENQAHTCGHDGHSTMLLGAALYLAQNKPKKGTVVIIFQPAEETGEGALKMMEDGLLERFPFEEIYGCHNMPWLGMGKAGMRVGATLSSYADFDIEIIGRGGHAGAQHSSVDPIQIAARLVTEISSMVGRYVDSKDSATIGIGVIEAGTARNIIPDAAHISGTIRTLSKDIQQMLIGKISAICNGYNTAYDCQAKLHIESLGIPCINDREATAIAANACTHVLGAENVDTDIDPYPFADDFAFFQEKVPGAYYFLGQDGVMVHKPEYDFDDKLIPVGASVFVNIIAQRLGLASPTNESGG